MTRPRTVYDDPRYRTACRELRKRDRTCHHCGYPIDVQLKWPHPLSWSADHIIPKSKLQPGDSRLWHIANLRASHLRCNESRGNKTTTPVTPEALDW